jgi:hypothetical protein
MNRIATAKAIMDLPMEVLQVEPDIFDLVQSHFEAGCQFFDALQNEDRRTAFERLVKGPWTGRQLTHFYEQLLEIASLIQEASKGKSNELQ